jgi:cellulose synthase/poly-beta-1,6-N-acetylglucosamine synthase-like glycosyltransferase
MGNYILTITAFFQIFVFAIICYYMVLAFFGLFRKKEKKNYEPKNKFALLIAAHNEEVVIGSLIESMTKLDYPKDMYDVFVIADNCTDDTAKIAKSYGVNVCERFAEDKRGKGYALEWMFAKLFDMEKQYDAIAIFDADNLVHKDFLREMNSKMQEGYKVVQGYIDSKNPGDSWIAASYSIGFWTQNRMFQLAKSNLGLSSQIGGTGFAIETNTLKKLGWGATCLTEDLEFTCKLVLNGEKVGWAHDAIIYDEKPLTLKQSWNQRKRWMQGFSDVASRYFFKLLKQSIVKRKFFMFDCSIYVLQPFVTLLTAMAALLTLIQANSSGLNIFIINYLFDNLGLGTLGYQIFAVVQFLITPFILLLDKKITKPFLVMMVLSSSNVFAIPIITANIENWIVAFFIGIAYNVTFLVLTGLLLGKKEFLLFFRFWLYSIYTLTWVPITIQGILNKNNKEWSHTKHVRKIEICDV